jgi:CRISPR-associated protein Csm1
MENFNQREYQTVILGALLHDVGKMLQRGNFGSLDTSGKHPQVSSVFVSAFKEFFSKFVDFELFQTIVQRHHEDPRLGADLICQNAPPDLRALCYLVSQADNYSSSERSEKTESYQDFKLTPLVSVFGRVEVDKDLPEVLKYRLNKLSPENAFPEKFNLYDENEFNVHLKNFGEDFKKLTDGLQQPDFDILISNLLTLLMKYAWCIPSNTQEQIPDVSLFDHLKTTCVIAACLYQYHHPHFIESEVRDSDVEKFVLLVGDLSGIQKYIFGIKHVGAGGAAKRLRARSFQVSINAEIVSHKILHAFNLPLANILMVSGGKFYILLPRRQDLIDRLRAVITEIDSWFYKELHAEINVNIATLSLSGKDFRDYSKALKRLNKTLQQTKKRPFASILLDDTGWSEERSLLDVDFGAEEKLCKACGRFPGIEREDGKFICTRCDDDKAAGQLLPNAKYIAFYKNQTGRFQAFGYTYDLLISPQAKHEPYLLVSIDEPLLNCLYPVSHRFIANHVSKFVNKEECDRCHQSDCSEKGQVMKDQPKMFECIANESTGRKMLGYLKADVDNLGAVFAFGLKENRTVSRVATLSRMLDVFFSGYMQKLIEDNYPELYTVYSGGDDVLVIGPWDSIIHFAQELNDEFKRFTCINRNLTLSAGIALVKHNYPVFRAETMADVSIKMSKNSPGKDSLTVFGQTAKWDRVSEIIGQSERLSGWLKNKMVSSGFARNLLIYSWMFNEFSKTRKTKLLRFLPLMTYDMARNLPSLNDRDPAKREVREWAEGLKDLNSPLLHNLGIIANYALAANRGGKNE